MPLYEFRCPNDHSFDRVLDLAEYDSLQYCECGQKAKRQITSVMFISNKFQSYESPIDGSIISTEKRRREEMVTHDCVDYEPSMKSESTKIMKDSDVALEREVDNTVDKFWDGLSAEKRQDFAKEVTNTELNYSRGS